MTYTFGTSGLLYNSNKLMFDSETHSLWSSLDGTPVIGPLVGTGLHLSLLSVVTTTWAEWRREHPETTVLSLDTGYKRDYSEGAAYHDYFATDRLMFQVAKFDDRLRNKDEVLVPRPADAVGAKPLAIAARFLQTHRVYQVPAATPSLGSVRPRDGRLRDLHRSVPVERAGSRPGDFAGRPRQAVTRDPRSVGPLFARRLTRTSARTTIAASAYPRFGP